MFLFQRLILVVIMVIVGTVKFIVNKLLLVLAVEKLVEASMLLFLSLLLLMTATSKSGVVGKFCTEVVLVVAAFVKVCMSCRCEMPS